MLYETVKALFSYALNIFYQISIINHGPIPADGPVIVYSNHPNYIVDLMVYLFPI